jgi:hypothetical protein
MNGRGRTVAFLVCLAVVLAFAYGVARSQSFSSASGTPLQIRQAAYVKASNPEADDHFGDGGYPPGHYGNAIAISRDGSTMAVGAPHESGGARGINGDQNDNSVYGAGAVYVFTRRGDSWAQQAYIKASNPGQSDHFGAVVALSADGNTLAVSAFWEASAAKGINGDENDDSIPQAGAAYVFTRTGNTWSQQAYIKPSNTGRASIDDNDFGDGDQFGFSLTLSADGNTLAAGAITEDSRASGVNNLAFQNDDSAASSGAVYVFTRTGTTWSQQAYLKAANADAGDLFGYNVALSANGNTLAVGVYDEDGSGRTPNAIPDNLRNGCGVVYVFDRTDGVWRQTAYLKGSRSQQNDGLGNSVTISDDGNTIAAGAGDENCLVPGVNPAGCDIDATPPDFGMSFSVGAVYIWARNGNAWTEQSFLKSSNPNLFDWFGVRTALSGDGNTLAVASQTEDGGSRGMNGNQADNSVEEAGAVYVFTRSGDTWAQQAYVKASNAEEYANFGTSLSMTRDGKTMVVGARGEASASKGVNGNQNDLSAPGSGAAYVFAIN